MPRTVSIKLMADVANFTRNVGGVAAGSVKTLGGELDKANKAGKLDKVTGAATGLGLGLVGLAGAAVKMSMDFEKSMSGVQAATHASSKDMGQLRQAAIQAGKDTMYSATEAADAITELSKAGVSTADVLGGGLAGALSLASAGELSVSEAAETAASAMTQFGLSGDKVPHVADLLAAAAGKAQGSVHQLGYALSQSGLVAAQMGLSIEDTTGTLAAFASAGLLGSDSGTSFKTMLLALQNPSLKTMNLMEDLGISAYDASGQFVGIAKFAGILQEKMSNLTPETRQMALAQIFGNDAVRSGTILYNQGAKGIQDWINKTNDAGFAAETAAMKTDNLSGDLERLKGSIETMAIEAGGGANGGLRILTQAVGGLIDQIGNLPPAIGSSLTVLAGVSGALLLVGVGWVKARKATAEALEELRSTGPVGERAASGLGKVTSAAGKVAAAFAALEIASAIVHHFQDDLNPQVDALAAGLVRYADGGKLAGEASRLLGGDLGDLEQGFKFLADGDNARRAAVRNLQGALESLPVGLDGASTSLTKTKERIDAIDQAMSQLVKGGQADQAKAVFDRLATSLATGGVSMDEFRKQFPVYAASLETAAAAADDAATGTKKAALGTDDLGKAAGKAREEVKSLQKAFKDLFDQYMSADQAEIKMRESTIATNKELESGRRTLELSTEAGRKHRKTVLDQIDTINDLRTANIENGMAVDKSDSTYKAQIETLRKHLLALGYDKQAVKELIAKYLSVPGQVNTSVKQPGMTEAQKHAHDYNWGVRQIPGSVNTKISVTGAGAAEADLKRLSVYQQALKKGTIPVGFNGPIRGPDGKYYAEGGWTGPGSKYQPAGVVHADEFVIQKESRQKIESVAPGLLDRMNQTGEVPGYAGGGAVWPFQATAAGTRIPSKAEVASVVMPAGGHTSDWIVNAVRSAFPGLAVYSKDRPGARTLSGNVSYHSLGRAVDFAPSRALAQWWNEHFMARTKELISPWNDLNIHNGQRHTYTGAIYRQHNFAGGNAHDHIAMANGGVINEPVFGYGASGRSYSFGERGSETVIPGGGGGATTIVKNYYITANVPPTANKAEIGREVVGVIQAYERGSGRAWRY